MIEGWDDPGIASYIHTRDLRYGLPDPVIQTIFPDGPLPAQCPAGMVALGSYGSCDAWAGELRLDVLTVHLIAPYAKIVISATPADSQITDDAASNVAPPEMMRALEYISTNHVANVISISDGTGEGTYSFGKAQIHANDPGPLAAAAAGIPVLNATGDCGVVQNLAVANAGFSAVYPRPAYQNDVARITGSPWRSVPDITMDSQQGTSESAPMVAGVLALATRLNGGRNLGPINPVLYDVLGPLGARAGISDVVSVASGWGTIDASKFVPALVAGTLAFGEEFAARAQAAGQLSELEHSIRLSHPVIAPGGTSSVSDGGFLPGHPVKLADHHHGRLPEQLGARHRFRFEPMCRFSNAGKESGQGRTFESGVRLPDQRPALGTARGGHGTWRADGRACGGQQRVRAGTSRARAGRRGTRRPISRRRPAGLGDHDHRPARGGRGGRRPGRGDPWLPAQDHRHLPAGRRIQPAGGSVP